MASPTEKERVQQYLTSMELVECINAKELVGMTDEEAWRRMQLLVACETPWRDRPDWSGLVEQQAIFHRKKA